MNDATVRLTCPECGSVATEAMPTDNCVHFYECSACQALLTPKHGDCCVFCSYGDQRCPSAVRESCPGERGSERE